MIVPARTYVKVWAALLILLALTIGLALVNLGPLNFPVAMLIATAKLVLIVLFFMHIRGSNPILHLAAGAGILWLAILFALTLNDYFTRHEVTWLTH